MVLYNSGYTAFPEGTAGLTGSTIEDSANYGIHIYRTSPRITNNTILRSGTYGIYARQSELYLKDNNLDNTGVYAGTGIYHDSENNGVYGSTGTTLISGNTIKAFARGMHLYRCYNHNYDVVNNRIFNNSDSGIRLYIYSDNGREYTFTGNSIYGNGGYAFQMESGPSSVTIDATECWWGTENPFEIPELIYDNSDNSSYAVVNILNSLNNPYDAAIVSVSHPVVTTILPPGSFVITIQFPERMNTAILPTVFYDPYGSVTVQPTFNPQWSTTVFPDDTLTVYNTNTIDYSIGNGRAAILVSGAQAESGHADFVYADAFFVISLGSDPGGPVISQVSYPGTWVNNRAFDVTAFVTDESQGDNGVFEAILTGGYLDPYDAIVITGSGPGGDGDGTWTFSVPAQTEHGGETLQFQIVAIDTTGRQTISGWYTTQILSEYHDDDHDGLPDWWELFYFGNLNQSRKSDPDDDHISNILEYSLGSQPNDSEDSDLIALWNFDAGDCNDATGNGHDGIRSGCAFISDSVKGTYALQFIDTGDTVNFGFDPVFKSTTFTLAGYIKIDSLPSVGENIVWDNLDPNNGMRVYVDNSGSIGFRSRGPSGEAEILTGLSILSDSWYHLAVASDGNTVSIYVNGALAGQGIVTGRFEPASMTIRTYVANNEAVAQETQFRGTLDEISFWKVPLSEEQIRLFSNIFIEDFSIRPSWRTGYQDGAYLEDDSTNFAWDDVNKVMNLVIPNFAADPDEKYCYQFTDRTGHSFFFRYDVTITNPGYEAPLRIGLKQNSQLPWGADQGISCAFEFRSSGFALDVYAKDGTNQEHEMSWLDGFRLDDPPIWVTVLFRYEASTGKLNFTLTDRSTATTLTSHEFTSVSPFADDLDKIIISSRGQQIPSSGYTTEGKLDNIQILPFAANVSGVTRIIFVSTNGSDIEGDGSIGNPYATIQHAIANASHGDTIMVLDGTYTGAGNRDIDFQGLAISLRSQGGSENCIIDCQGTGIEPHRGFHFHSNERSNSVVEGFKIINGYTLENGGAIYCQGASPTILRCIIANNTGNIGGGIHSDGVSTASVINSVIAGNVAVSGGGISCDGSAEVEVINCTITENRAGQGGGVFCKSEALAKGRNSILWGNESLSGPQVSLSQNSIIDLDYCDIEGGLTDILGDPGATVVWGFNNVDTNPLFVNEGVWDANTWTEGDYHIAIASDCINAGDNRTIVGYDYDLSGNQRIIAGQVDIGPYEIEGVRGDLTVNGIVNFLDFAVLAEQWKRTDCNPSNGWCRGADFDLNTVVDFADLRVLCDNWLDSEPIRIVEFKLNADPSWTTEGQWGFGHPLGLGGTDYGNPDPTSGFTGQYVYGVNLEGDYSTAIGGPYCLTAGPFDCSGYRNVELKFKRWLNSDEPQYVKSKVEVTHNSVDWHTVWELQGRDAITDSYWNTVEYHISPFADGQSNVYIRWSYEVEDFAYPYSGWNIDDIELWGMQ